MRQISNTDRSNVDQAAREAREAQLWALGTQQRLIEVYAECHPGASGNALHMAEAWPTAVLIAVIVDTEFDGLEPRRNPERTEGVVSPSFRSPEQRQRWDERATVLDRQAKNRLVQIMQLRHRQNGTEVFYPKGGPKMWDRSAIVTAILMAEFPECYPSQQAARPADPGSGQT
jgi:hypothetical protein